MLPFHIISNISEYIPLNNSMGIFKINKHFFEMFQKKYLKKIIFIQRIYRKYRLPQIYIFPGKFLMYHEYCHWQKIFYRNNKNRLYRYFIAKYSDAYIYYFPKHVLNKGFMMNSSRHSIVKDWLDNNFLNKENKTRKDVFKFFKENRITFKEISDAGL